MFAPDDDIYSPKSSLINDDSNEWDSHRLNFYNHLNRHGHDNEVFTFPNEDSVERIGIIMKTLSVTGALVVVGIIVTVLACCLCRRRRNRGLVLAPPTGTTTTVTTAGPRAATTVVSVPAVSVPYPTQQYYAPSPAPVIQPYPVTYPPQSYPMPAPYPAHAPVEHPSAPGYNAPPPTYEQATDATTKQPPYNPYAPS